MKILQEITIDDTTYIFTENPEQDVVKIQELYQDENRESYMGYDLPILTDFLFLGTNYKCISFWNDNEDPQKINLNNL